MCFLASDVINPRFRSTMGLGVYLLSEEKGKLEELFRCEKYRYERINVYSNITRKESMKFAHRSGI